MSAYSPEALPRPGRRERTARPSITRIRAWLTAAVAWLCPRAPDVVRIEIRSSHAASADPPPRDARAVRRQVEQWRRRIRMARVVVVLRRDLLLALALAVVGLALARIATSQTVPVWAFAGVAVALLAAVVALAMPIADAAVASMLDRELGLFERVETALELELSGTDTRILAREVVAEAQASLSSSFRSARARPAPRRLELALLVALGVAVALLVVLPGSGAGVGKEAAHGNRAAATGTVRGHGVTATAKHRSGTSTLPVGAAVDNRPSPGLAISPSTTKTGNPGGASPYGNGATSKGASEITKTGLSNETATTSAISAPGSSTGLGGSKSSSGGSSSVTGSSGAKTSGKSGGGGGLSAPGSAPSVTAGAIPKGSKTSSGTSGAAAATGSGSQSGSQTKAPPGGDNAGATLGSTQLQSGLSPDLPQGDSGLPLQAGYAPSPAHSPGNSGISQTPNGGGGKARSAAGGSGSTGNTSAPAIQPTPNTSSTGTQPVLSNYFGSANQLTPGSW